MPWQDHKHRLPADYWQGRRRQWYKVRRGWHMGSEPIHVSELVMADRIRELEAKVERLTNRVVEQECELDRIRDLEAVEKAAYELLLCNTGHRDGCGCDFCGYMLRLSKAVEDYHKTINAV